jgi:hypothetical protein
LIAACIAPLDREFLTSRARVDQADSTAQFLDWFKTPMPDWVIFEWTRQRVQELEQRRKPPPVKTV